MWKRWFKLYFIHSEVISLSDSELVLSADRVQEKSSLWPSVSFHIDFKMIVLVYEASRGRSTRLHLTKLSADEAGRLGSARQVIHKAELKHLAAFSLRGAEIL